LAAKCIFRHIYGWGLEGCYESNATIAQKLGIGASTVSHSVSELHKMGVLYVYTVGTYRRAWAVSHPAVQAASTLHCRGAEISKSRLKYRPPEAVLIGQIASKIGQQGSKIGQQASKNGQQGSKNGQQDSKNGQLSCPIRTEIKSNKNNKNPPSEQGTDNPVRTPLTETEFHKRKQAQLKALGVES
jgi:hypothetical protein